MFVAGEEQNYYTKWNICTTERSNVEQKSMKSRIKEKCHESSGNNRRPRMSGDY